MNGTKSSGISVEVSPNGIHVLPPGYHIRHPYHHVCKLCGTETAHMLCLLPRCRICRHVCLLHHTSNNVCYNCIRLTGMLGNHVLDQSVCLLYLYQTSNPVIIATGSVDIFTITHVLLCRKEPAHMSETKTPS